MLRTPGRVAQAKPGRGGEACERAGEYVAVPGGGLGALEVGGEHVESSLPPLRFQVNAADETLAGKHRETVVPVAASTRRLVDLDSLLEVEQELHPRAVPEQWIEGDSITLRSRRGRRRSSSGRRSRSSTRIQPGSAFPAVRSVQGRILRVSCKRSSEARIRSRHFTGRQVAARVPVEAQP